MAEPTPRGTGGSLTSSSLLAEQMGTWRPTVGCRSHPAHRTEGGKLCPPQSPREGATRLPPGAALPAVDERWGGGGAPEPGLPEGASLHREDAAAQPEAGLGARKRAELATGMETQSETLPGWEALEG